jgi:hypothetical protein
VPGERPGLTVSAPRGSGALLRRALDANLRYYEALGELTLDYLRSLRTLTSDGDAPAPTAAAPAPPPATLVLEAQAGETAVGAFLVQNLLDERVSAPVIAGAFTAEDGGEADLTLKLDPEVVTLEPGEQQMVRTAAAVTDRLEPGVGYRGEVSVPGLTGTRVPIVVRRRS